MEYQVVKINPKKYGYKDLKPFTYALELNSNRGFGFTLLNCYTSENEAIEALGSCQRMQKILSGGKHE